MERGSGGTIRVKAQTVTPMRAASLPSTRGPRSGPSVPYIGSVCLASLSCPLRVVGLLSDQTSDQSSHTFVCLSQTTLVLTCTHPRKGRRGCADSLPASAIRTCGAPPPLIPRTSATRRLLHLEHPLSHLARLSTRGARTHMRVLRSNQERPATPSRQPTAVTRISTQILLRQSRSR